MVKKNYLLYTIYDSKKLKTVAQDVIEVGEDFNNTVTLEVVDQIKARYPSIFTKNNEDNLSISVQRFDGSPNLFI